MAARLEGDFYTLNGDSYTVGLHDTTFGGAAYDATIRNIRIKWDGEEDIHNPILTSSCEVTFSVVDSSTEAIFSTMVGAAEEQYLLRIEKGGTLYWCGVVLPDLVKFSDAKYPYDFTIKATDGIGRLKDIPYNNAGTDYTGWETMTGHILNCLNKIPTSDEFYGATDVFLGADLQWWETSVTSPTATAALQSNALDHLRVRHKVWRTVDKDGNTVYMSCYDVLKTICRTFGCRLFYSAGRFLVLEVNLYRYTGIHYINQYYKGGTETTAETVNGISAWTIGVDNSATRLAASAEATLASGGIQRYLSPAQKVEVQYRHFSTQNLLPGAIWTDISTPTEAVDDFDSNSAAARLLITADVRHSISFTTPANFVAGYFKFRVLVSLNDGGGTTYYLKRSASFNSGTITYGTPIWTTTASDRLEFFTNAMYLNATEFLSQWSFVTPAVPDDGTLSVRVDFDSYQNSTGTVADSGGTAYTEDWQVSNFYLEGFYEGRVDDRSNTTVSKATGESTNSDVIKIDTVIGQGPNPNAYGYIQAQQYTGGSFYTANGFRTISDSTYRELGTRLAYEVLSRRYAPCPMLQGTIIADGNYEAHYLLFRDGPEYIMLSATFNMRRDEWDGVWGQIDYTAPTISAPGTPVEYESYDPLGATEGATIQQPIQGPPKSPPDYGLGPAPAPDTGGRNAATGIATGQAAWASDTAIDAGDSVTSISITSISDASSNYQFYADDVVDIYNPFTGQRQYFDVSSYTFGTITTPSTTADFDFPVGSYVLPNYDWLINLIQVMRQQFIAVSILDGGTNVTTGVNNGFWRVWQNLASGVLLDVIVSVHSPGAGAGTLAYDVKVGGSTQDSTSITGTGTSQTSSLDYALSGNELVEIDVTSVSGFTTLPKGLVMTLVILRQV